MITKTTIRYYRMARGSGFILLFGAPISLCLLGQSEKVFLLFTSIATTITVSAAVLWFCSKMCLARDYEKVLDAWTACQLPLKLFPVTADERKALEPWALEILTQKARAANASFAYRDQRLAVLREELGSITVKKLDDLPELRAKQTSFESAKNNLEWAADHCHKEFLTFWDLLTKLPSDGGAGILINKKYDWPQDFRMNVDRAER